MTPQGQPPSLPRPPDLPGGATSLPGKPRRRRNRAAGRILRGTAALPALFTILNGLAGFGSLHFATRDGLGRATIGHLMMAAWLLLAAMVCDMLDGRLARFARKTSEFGAQLDSLCDIISFGVAPAMLMPCTVIMAIKDTERLQFLPDLIAVEQVLWCIAAIYVACAALRLARFNVENVPDESAHLSFKGLPSPGAAALIMALVLLFADLAGHEQVRPLNPWLMAIVSVVLPATTLAAALLMVSNFRYPHVINQYIRGKRPFGFLVKLTVLIVAALLWPYLTGVIVIAVFVLSGPARALWRRMPWRKPPAPA